MARGTDTSRLADTLRAARHERGWSRETLAHESGMSWAAITQIETGRRTEVRVSSLVALAEALGVSVDYLVRCDVAPLMYQHKAYVYDSPGELAAMIGPVINAGLEAGQTNLFVSTRRNIGAMKKALGTDAKRVVFGESRDWFTSPAAAATRFQTFARDALRDTSTWVQAFGEQEWTGRSRAEIQAWRRFDSLSNALLAAWPVSAGCLYAAQSAPRQVMTGIDHTHPEVVTPDGVRVSSSFAPVVEYVTS
jgi:DNA-binding Xre family transcriptional regulator